jgi:hypothetical protein
VLVTANTLLLPSTTLWRHLTHSKTIAQACSSVIGALKLLVIFCNVKQLSLLNWHGVQLVSPNFGGTFEVAMRSKQSFEGFEPKKLSSP